MKYHAWLLGRGASIEGPLHTYYLKQMAQGVAGQVDGVQREDNQIEIVASAAELRLD